MKRKTNVKPGDKILNPGIYRGPVHIMAVADGYIMCRRPRFYPFVVTVKTWEKWREIEDKR